MRADACHDPSKTMTTAINRIELMPLILDLWHAERGLKTFGMPATSRMTVVRLQGGGL